MNSQPRLIDSVRYKQTLLRFREKLQEFGKQEAAECVNTLIKGLKLEPKVDAVAVVRCGSCVHRHKRSSCHGRPMDFFCADGERSYDDA